MLFLFESCRVYAFLHQLCAWVGLGEIIVVSFDINSITFDSVNCKSYILLQFTKVNSQHYDLSSPSLILSVFFFIHRVSLALLSFSLFFFLFLVISALHLSHTLMSLSIILFSLCAVSQRLPSPNPPSPSDTKMVVLVSDVVNRHEDFFLMEPAKHFCESLFVWAVTKCF